MPSSSKNDEDSPCCRRLSKKNLALIITVVILILTGIGIGLWFALSPSKFNSGKVVLIFF